MNSNAIRPVRTLMGRSGVVASVFVSCAGLFLVSACATGGSAPNRGDIGTLEAELRRDPAAVPVRVRLAIAYRDSGDVARSIALLEPVVAEDPRDAAASLWLGIVYEDAGRFAEARRQYTAFLTLPGSAALRERVEARIDRVTSLETRQAVRQSLERERELTTTAPEPRTVGVFPFLFAGADSTLRPLGRALAELLTTDLAQTDRLRVLERSQVQVLTDEMALVRENFVDPATAARTGRMLRSAHIVQGRIDGSQSDLTVQAQVVATESPRDTASGPIRQGGGIARLFDMEKQIALGVYNRLGIQLTVAERQRVDRRATANVQALIAFGFGLESRDAGNYAEAVRQFTRATQFDPGFDQARALRDEAERRSRTPAATQEMARAAASSFDVTLTAWQRARLGIEALESAIPNPQMRDPIVEVLGKEGLGRGTGIDLIIRRPVGGS